MSHASNALANIFFRFVKGKVKHNARGDGSNIDGAAPIVGAAKGASLTLNQLRIV